MQEREAALKSAPKAASKTPERQGGKSATSARRYEARASAKAGASEQLGADAATQTIGTKSGGRPVDASLRAKVEGQVDTDLGAARVHDDANAQRGAAQMGARAFAYGTDIFLGPGESATDQSLMAHELTHVAQQGAAPAAPQRQVAVGPQDSPAEREADTVADAVAGNKKPSRMIVDEGGPALAPGQISKSEFLAKLEPAVRSAADQELGPVWSAVGCPYIDQYFAKYRNKSAAECERLVRRYTGSKSDDAQAVIATFVAIVRRGVKHWRTTGELPPEAKAFAPAGVAGPKESTNAAQMKARLGEGRPLDAETSGRMGDALGTDISAVRIHTGPRAAMLAAEQGASAFTVGSDLAFANGKFQPGTFQGDALLAHELAHVGQQEGAQPKKHDAPESQATEQDADKASAGVLARLYGGVKNIAGNVGPALKSGFGLSRCIENTKKGPDDVAAFVKEYGFKINFTPEFSKDKPYIVGQKMTYGFSTEKKGPLVYNWKIVDPKGRTMKNNGQQVNYTVPLPGSYTLKASVRMPGGNLNDEYVVERTFDAVLAKPRADKLRDEAKDQSYGEFRGAQEVNLAILKPKNEVDKNASFHIKSDAANPTPVGEGKSAPIMGFDLKQKVKAKKGRTLHWYARPLNSSSMPKDLGGKPQVTVKGVGKAYDLGTGTSASIPASHPNLYVIICQVRDGKARVADVTYMQSVLTKKDIAEVDKFEKYVERSDKFVGEMKGERVPLTAVHVSSESGHESRLGLFIGKKSKDKLMLADLTPGLDPKNHTLRYYGDSVKDLVDQYKEKNKMPKGHVSMRLGANKIGLKPKNWSFATDGQSALGGWAGGLGILSAVLAVAGILAAPFTGGASLTVTALMVGSAALGIAAGTLSIIDRLEKEETDEMGVAIDAATIAASFFAGGAAVRALRGGPVVLLATRGGRFLLYSSFATDAIAGLLIAVDGAAKIAGVLERDDLNEDQKRSEIMRIVTGLVVTGALLAISYRDVAKMGSRFKTALGDDLAKKLPLSTKMTLSLFDDATLKALKGSTQDDLTRLAGVLRDDPGSLGRLMARKGELLPALKAAAGGSSAQLEVAFLRTRMDGIGIKGDTNKRIAAAVDASGLPAKGIFDLDDASLKLMASADAKLAKDKVNEAMSDFNKMTSVPADARGRIESSLAKANGQKDPAYTRDAKAAVLRDHPDLDKKLKTALSSLDNGALSTLAGATPEQVKMVAKVAQLDSVIADRLLKNVPNLTSHKIEVVGDALRINGQIDIHPSGLRQVDPGDLSTLLDATNPVDKAKLALFTKSNPYRFRFRFQLETNENWLTKLLQDAGLGSDARATKLLASMDDAGRGRLNEPRAGSYPKGVKDDVQQQAAKYALSKNDSNVREFVNHFEMYVSEYTRLRNDFRDKIRARIKARGPGVSEDKAWKDAAKDLLGEEVTGFTAPFNKAVLKKMSGGGVQGRYDALKGELGTRTGAKKAKGTVTTANAVSKVRSTGEVNFGSESSAVYHANKHHSELPGTHKTGSGNELTQYLDSAKKTVAGGTAKVKIEQDGGIKVTFERTYAKSPPQQPTDVKMRAMVRVNSDGSVVLATYGSAK